MCIYVLHWGGVMVINFLTVFLLLIVSYLYIISSVWIYFHTVRFLDTYFHIT
jgi:hypothetical protein